MRKGGMMEKKKEKGKGGTVYFQSAAIAGAALFVYAGITAFRLVLYHVWYWEDLAVQVVLWMLFLYWVRRHERYRFEETALVLSGRKAFGGEEKWIPYEAVESVRPVKEAAAGAVRLCSRMDRRPMYALTVWEKGRRTVFLLKETEYFWDRLSARCPGRVYTEASEYLDRRMKRRGEKRKDRS